MTTTHSDTLATRTGDLASLLQGRRSVRQYQTRPVARELVEQVLEAARWAPSPHGRQPWRFVVITRQEVKAQLTERMGETWQRQLQMDGQAAEIVAIRKEKSRQRILGAPAIIYAAADPQRRERLPLDTLVVRFD